MEDWIKTSDVLPKERASIITACVEYYGGELAHTRQVICENELLGFYAEDGQTPTEDNPAWQTDNKNTDFYKLVPIAWMPMPDDFEDVDYIPCSERNPNKEFTLWNPSNKRYRKTETDDAHNDDYVETRKEEIEKYGYTKWDNRDYHPNVEGSGWGTPKTLF